MHEVRSAPIEPPRASPSPTRGKASAVFSRTALARSRGPVERILAWATLAASWLGSVVTFHGSWGALVSQPQPGLIALGLALQAVLTYAQWAYPRTRMALVSRGLDAATTAYGYAPLFWLGWLVSLLVGWGLPGETTVLYWTLAPAAIVAWLVSWAVCVLPAWYPESRLID